jgi:hypothetical protein
MESYPNKTTYRIGHVQLQASARAAGGTLQVQQYQVHRLPAVETFCSGNLKPCFMANADAREKD